MRRQTRFIRRLFHSLKREYGFDITFHKKTSETLDLEDGTSTSTIVIQRVRRAIILPDEMQRKFEYDLAFIAADKNFTYGGFYDTSMRRIIVDKQDLNDFTLELTDYFIWGEKRWEVAKISDFEFQTGFVVWARLVEGTIRYQVSEYSLESTLTFSGETS